jgi:hypothetical protein
VADELGTAVLRIVADDSAARESLNVLRRDVEQLTTRATRAASRTTQAAPRTGGAGGGGGTAPDTITRQDVRRFNLRGLNAALDDVNQDIAALRVGRRLNISSSWNKFLTQLEETQRDIERAAQTEGRRIGRLNVSPVRGGAAFPGSPAFLDRALPSLPASYFSGLKRRATQQSKRQADIVSNALIGGAFPLLFGQGIGAAVGGAGGGAAGGAVGGQFGFGLSLVGTAVGAQFDAIIEKATVLGRALEDPIRNFSAVQESALLSSRGLERQVESLIAVGRQAEAAALVQADLAKAYGGAEAARRLADEQDNLSRSWTLLSVNLGQIALPSIAAAVGDTAEALKGFVALLQLIKGLVPDIPLPQGGQTGSAFFNPLSGGFGAATAIESGKILGRLFGGDDPAKSAKEVAAATQAALNAEQQRRELLSAQLGAITAQVQGYERLGVERELEVSLLKQAIDLDNLRARGAKQPELDARAQEGNLERFRLQERLNQLVRQEQVIQASRGPILQSQLRLIDQQARGLERQALITQRDLIRREAAKQTGLRPGERGQIEDAALVDTARINAQILALDRERLATSQQQAAQLSIGVGALDRQIASAQRLSRISNVGASSILRENAALIQGVLESVSTSVDRQREIESRIQAARTRGGDASQQEIQSLLGQQTIAAQQTQLALVTGAGALRDAGRQLADNIQRARDGIRSVLEGSFNLLRPQIQQRLLSEARSRVDTSLFDPRKLTTPSEVFQAAGASESVQRLQQEIATSNTALGQVNRELVSTVQQLVSKNWNVAVNVQGGSAQAIGDVVGALS